MNKKNELYKCEKCGTEFEVSPIKRISTFVLHKQHEWQCPTCGRTCFQLNSKDDKGFSGSGGGKF